jgi:hypothetical protein
MTPNAMFFKIDIRCVIEIEENKSSAPCVFADVQTDDPSLSRHG